MQRSMPDILETPSESQSDLQQKGGNIVGDYGGWSFSLIIFIGTLLLQLHGQLPSCRHNEPSQVEGDHMVGAREFHWFAANSD